MTRLGTQHIVRTKIPAVYEERGEEREEVGAEAASFFTWFECWAGTVRDNAVKGVFVWELWTAGGRRRAEFFSYQRLSDNQPTIWTRGGLGLRKAPSALPRLGLHFKG